MNRLVPLSPPQRLLALTLVPASLVFSTAHAQTVRTVSQLGVAGPAHDQSSATIPGYSLNTGTLSGVKLRPLPDPIAPITHSSSLPADIAAQFPPNINDPLHNSHTWLAAGQLHPATETYEHLVDGLKGGQSIAVVQYGRLKQGNGTILATGARRFGLRYLAAEGSFKLSPLSLTEPTDDQLTSLGTPENAITPTANAPETTIAGDATLQDVMFTIHALPLTCRHNQPCAASAPAAGRVQLGVSWEESPATNTAQAPTNRRWPGWLSWLTLKPLWQRQVQVEGEAALAS